MNTQNTLPDYFSSHVVALAGVILLHSGFAAWAMMPSPPVVIPQQQVIQVSMVAPTILQQEITSQKPEEQKRETPKVPPKEQGMVKVDPEQKPVEKTIRPQEEQNPEHIASQQAKTMLTSGLQDARADQKESAITEPVAASYLKNQPPRYPNAARRNSQQGTVLLEVQVSTTGNPKAVRVEKSSGFSTLDQAALKAVKNWQFVPARRGSHIVEASVLIPIVFKLNS